MRLPDTDVFKNYTCYKSFHKGMQRWQVMLAGKVSRRTERTILYSKYLMSIKVGRILSEEEQVDHVDGNKVNDEILNLEIVTGEENLRRWAEKKPAAVLNLK